MQVVKKSDFDLSVFEDDPVPEVDLLEPKSVGAAARMTCFLCGANASSVHAEQAADGGGVGQRRTDTPRAGGVRCESERLRLLAGEDKWQCSLGVGIAAHCFVPLCPIRPWHITVLAMVVVPIRVGQGNRCYNVNKLVL